MLLARFPRSLPLVFSLLAVSLPGATAPSWWSAPDTRVLEPGGIPHDFSPATLGQLKFVATQAKKYLDLKLAAADGAGTAVNAVCQFSQVDNYAPVSLGQLKFIAKPFYDRLAAIHYNWNTPGTEGLPNPVYPWSLATSPANAAPATLGQLKFVFAFELSNQFLTLDTDADGLPNWHERLVGTSTEMVDTDDDGFSDKEEIAEAADPLDAENHPPGLFHVSRELLYIYNYLFLELRYHNVDASWDSIVNPQNVYDENSPNKAFNAAELGALLPLFPIDIPSSSIHSSNLTAYTAEATSAKFNFVGLEHRAFMRQYRFWLSAKPAQAAPRQRTFLRVSTSWVDDNEQNTVVGTFTFTIPPNATQSLPIDLVPDPADPIAAAIVTETLLPIEFKNVRDVANAGDDSDITPKQNATDTSINSVAWIDNHSSGTNAAPRMPQLRLSIPGLSSDMRIKAKLEVDYTRPYVGHQTEDRVRVPSNGNFREVTGSAWDIYNDADWTTAIGQGFFGGDATLTYQLTKADGTVVMQNQTVLFRIAGQNPEDARCKDYIVTQSGAAWFAYALAKHESNLYGGEATYYPFTPVSPNNAKYNQFRALGGGQSGTRVAGREGIPLIERAEASGPGGIGMFQVTGSATDQTDIIPRAQLWNWQENVNGALAIIQNSIKSGLATRFYNDIKNDSARHLEAFNADPPPTITIGNTDFSSDDAIWLTSYNGWGGTVKSRYKFNPDLPAGLTIPPTGQTKRWYFNPPMNPDEFYIRKVERLLETN